MSLKVVLGTHFVKGIILTIYLIFTFESVMIRYA